VAVIAGEVTPLTPLAPDEPFAPAGPRIEIDGGQCPLSLGP
jgi:hypothetical protein